MHLANIPIAFSNQQSQENMTGGISEAGLWKKTPGVDEWTKVKELYYANSFVKHKGKYILSSEEATVMQVDDMFPFGTSALDMVSTTKASNLIVKWAYSQNNYTRASQSKDELRSSPAVTPNKPDTSKPSGELDTILYDPSKINTNRGPYLITRPN